MKIIAQKGSTNIYINGLQVQLPALLRDSFQLDNKYIVLVDEHLSKANIFAFDESGNQLWQVQENTFKHLDSGYTIIYPIVNSINTFSAALGETWYEIDTNTGKIISTYGDRQKTVYFNRPKKGCWLFKFLYKKKNRS